MVDFGPGEVTPIVTNGQHLARFRNHYISSRKR
ncbi:MAG: hypothetical protein ACI809_000560 [Candidatus Azotimanducaceae bacterium]